MVDAETLGDAGAVVLQEHVRRLDEFEQDRPALPRLQVDRQAALVAVQGQEGDVDPVAARAAGSGVALPLARDRLDLDDVGAEIAEPLAGERTGHGDRAIKDPISRKHTHQIRLPLDSNCRRFISSPSRHRH